MELFGTCSNFAHSTLYYYVAPMSFVETQNRPSLINYNPVANPFSVVMSPDGMARFTVLTDSVIRMEYAKDAGIFEDR